MLAGTHVAWCMTCKSRQESQTIQTVEVFNPKRRSRRTVGRCLTCAATTSTIVA
jgi:hypothetical protein